MPVLSAVLDSKVCILIECGYIDLLSTKIPCPVILVAVIKVGDITVAVIWVGSEVWSFWSRSLRSRSFRSWSFLSVF